MIKMFADKKYRSLELTLTELQENLNHGIRELGLEGGDAPRLMKKLMGLNTIVNQALPHIHSAIKDRRWTDVAQYTNKLYHVCQDTIVDYELSLTISSRYLDNLIDDIQGLNRYIDDHVIKNNFNL